MELLTLYCGLLLPWLGGTVWFALIESRFSQPFSPNRFRQAGYGFFLGYAILFLTILIGEQLTGSVSWVSSMLVFLALTTIGGVLGWHSSKRTSIASAITPATNPHKTLTTVMMVMMAIHLLFIATEIFTQPVYPWDAWLAWIYRAKAWYLTGSLSDIVNPANWTTATSANTYTIDAYTYPLFPSIIPYWAALSLGRWSETLINLPVLFAGLAIGMALYGQCREHGLNVPASLVSCYLLFSIPLFGTHLALAGYADIWMAGFTGLGFVALIRGASLRDAPSNSGFHFITGFLMVMFSIWVKNEGAVWLLAALGMLILVMFRPRVPILMVVTAIGIGLVAFSLGSTSINIPLLGQLGFSDGRMSIPFIGDFALELHDVRQVYWDNFIKMGSWNLIWVAVVASLILGFKSPNTRTGYRARRAALSFILIFLTTQLFIFGFTDQGLWADTYTAINRLPLHFIPALLFAIIIIAFSSLPLPNDKSIGKGNSPRQFLAIFASASMALVIVITATVASLSKDLSSSTGTKHSFSITDFKFAFGSGIPLTGKMRIDQFNDGYALLSSGPVSFQAKHHRVLRYNWRPANLPLEAAFFWRRSDDPQTVVRTEITVTGSAQIDLSTEPAWKGEITEIGFLLAGENGEAIELGDITLIPDNLTTRLQLIWQAWTVFEPWSQQSINFLHGGDYRQSVSLPLLVTSWLLICLFLFWLVVHVDKSVKHRNFLTTAATSFLLVWLLLDLRWTTNNLRQIQQSFQTRWSADDLQRSSKTLDGDLHQYIQRLKHDVIGEPTSRILIIGNQAAIDYYLFRSKYHLLPHSVNVAPNFARGQTPASLDYVIFFGQPTEIVNVPGWNRVWRKSLVIADNEEWGVVYRVK